MAALSVQVPYPVFYDRDGDPLDNGNIYIGVANLDPIANPLQVYYDEALTIAATQPLKTSNGYIYRNGTPAQLYVDATNFSILVRDSKNTLVYSFPDGTGLGVDAASIEYDPPFAGSLTSGYTVAEKLEQSASIKDFGAVGDGIADDTAAVQAALNSQQPLDWGGLTYRITSTVSRTYTRDVFWEGRNATIVYDGSHVERALLLQGGGIEIVINDLTVNGGKLCNKPIEILNNSDNYSNITMTNVFSTRAKRLNTFSGGDGILFRGSFDSITLNGGGASDCELPNGQGTSGSAGITGIAVTFYSATRYVKSMRVNGVQIERVYSSDLAYQDDQDGLLYFTPDDPGGIYKVPGELIVSGGSSFLNCYGRSIKTQCRNTIVQNSHFERTEGLASGLGNGEVDAQAGSLSISDCVFVYDNAQRPGTCVNCSSDAVYGRPGLTAQNCEVYVDSSVTLDVFASTFPRSGLYSRHQIVGCKIFGKVKKLFDFVCRGDKNYAEVSNCFTNEIVNGETSQKALIYVRSGGSILSPYSATVTAFGNVHDNTDLPAIMRDGVPGTSMTAILSAWNNQGFANNPTANSAAAGLRTNQVFRLGRFTSGDASSYIEVLTKAIPSGGTETFTIANDSGCLVFAQAQFNSTAYALFSSTATTNTSISVGSSFALGNASNPGTGVFNVWSSAANQISIQNTSGSSRIVSVFVLAP